jgi:hypothetical protein
MTREQIFLPLLIATVTAGFAGLALAIAHITGDAEMLNELFSLAKTIAYTGACALIGLIAYSRRK